MKAIILAGGYGTRLSEATNLIPKPMVEIGGKPILWHVMKIYSHYGINDFIICCGYKGYIIKEYFANYYLHNSDMIVDLSNNSTQIINNNSEKWKVTLIDTGLNTMTGGRIKRIKPFIENESFCLTYGDGVADVDISKLITEHKKSGKLLSVMAYQPVGRLGVLEIDKDNSVKSFEEKPKNSGAWINAGFFVCEPGIVDYIEGDHEMFEQEPIQRIISDGQLHANIHEGFWRPMDTLKDNKDLNYLWENNIAKWKVW